MSPARDPATVLSMLTDAERRALRTLDTYACWQQANGAWGRQPQQITRRLGRQLTNLGIARVDRVAGRAQLLLTGLGRQLVAVLQQRRRAA